MLSGTQPGKTKEEINSEPGRDGGALSTDPHWPHRQSSSFLDLCCPRQHAEF